MVEIARVHGDANGLGGTGRVATCVHSSLGLKCREIIQMSLLKGAEGGRERQQRFNTKSVLGLYFCKRPESPRVS